MVQTLSSTVVDLNQKTYQRLKAALELNLRRQIFIAVCDNLVLRDRLAAELESDFSGHGAYSRTSSRNRSYPQFVTLKLDLSNPSPIGQIAQWLQEFPPPVNRQNQYLMPAFQLVGIEQLSRQSASVQWLFLNHLRSIEHSLPVLESSMVLWVTRPWSRMIPQSAPDFWRCRTAVFDFIGEPTPLVSMPETFPIASASTQLKRQTVKRKNGHFSSKSSDRPLHLLSFKPDEQRAAPQDETLDAPLPVESSVDTADAPTETQTEIQSETSQASQSHPSPAHPSHDVYLSSNTAHSRRDAETTQEQETGSEGVDEGHLDASELEGQAAIASDTLNESEQPTDEHSVDRARSREESITHLSSFLEDQEPLVLDEQEPEIQATLNELMNGTLMEDLGGFSEDTESETLDITDVRTSRPLNDRTVNSALNHSTSSTTESSPLIREQESSNAQEDSSDPIQQSDSHTTADYHAEVSATDSVSEKTEDEQASFTENLGFGDALNDLWSSSGDDASSDSIAEETPLSFASPDDTDSHTEAENVTDVLIPIEANDDDEAQDIKTVIDEIATGEGHLSNATSQHPETSDGSDSRLTDTSDSSERFESLNTLPSNGAGVPSSILLPYDAGAEDLVETVDSAGSSDTEELQILDAEPNFLNASLSSDPSLGFSTVGQTSAQRSWIESSLAESAQADLALEDPQAHALVQQIERLRQQQAPQAVLAGAYRGLGNLYRDRIEQGDISPKNLVRAMKAYESVLQMVSDTSPTWSEVLNDMGNLCWLLSRCAPTPEQGLPHLQQGIQAYRMALTKINPKTHPQTYPMIQNNLGAAYGDLARYHNPFDNLQQSVEAYQEALRYRKAEDDPMRFASTQNNLGTTYWNLAQYRDAVQNLKRATDAYAKALVYYQPDTDPLNYAMIQNNLGTAFWNLAQHDHSEKWLSAAIDAYIVALQYRTLETNPVAYAATQNNLGTAYWHISEYHEGNPESRMNFLRQAVLSYGEALSAAELIQHSGQPIALNFDVFATRNNFGLVQYQLATDSQFTSQNSNEEQLLENALDQHLSALQGWQGRPELRQTALQCVIQTLKAIYSQKGLIGQNLALSKIPGQLLPEILPQL